MALGASTVSVFRMMIVDALRLVALGIVVGMIAAAWMSRYLTSMLFETGRFDVITFVATALVLGVVAALASYVPARRGTRRGIRVRGTHRARCLRCAGYGVVFARFAAVRFALIMGIHHQGAEACPAVVCASVAAIDMRRSTT